MQSALVHFDPKQKQRLAKRARSRGKSFSQEVRDAVDLYLTLPVESEAQLAQLATAASRSADRSIRKLDETIEYVGRVLKRTRKAP